MFPVSDIEFTDYILQFGMSEDMLWVLFRTKPAEYHVMYDNEHFSAIANRLTQAKERDQPVHVRVQNVQILDLT
jgi:hypothetical protein